MPTPQKKKELSIKQLSSIDKQLLPVLHSKKNTASKRNVQQHRNQILSDLTFFEHEAQLYSEAGNLEEALSNTLLYGASLETMLQCCVAKDKPKYATELQEIEIKLHSLHQRLQSKMDYFHGCLDDNTDENDTPKSKWDCDGIQPLDMANNTLTLQSLIGHHHIKRDILQGIVEPFNQPLLFQMKKSFLFYGPPGTGKTMFAKASANSLQHVSENMNVLFFAPSTDALKDKHVGGTERKITQYFHCVQQQAEEATTQSKVHTLGIIFIDEIDSLARRREDDDASGTQASATNTLLQMLDGIASLDNVVVMAATNYPWQLDDAILSRFQEQIYVRLPDTPSIVELLKDNFTQFYVRSTQLNTMIDRTQLYQVITHICDIPDEAVELLAKRFHQPSTYSPSNIKDVCQQVFRKSARRVHRNGVFYPIHLQTGHASFHQLTHVEQSLMHAIHHKYASAQTYLQLRKHYPLLIAPTEPKQLSSSTHPSGDCPGEVTINGVEYIQVSKWLETFGVQGVKWKTVAETLEKLSYMHIYIPNTATFSEFEYVLFKTLPVQYGPESVHMFQVWGLGVVKPEYIVLFEKFASTLHYITGFLNVEHSPVNHLLQSITRMYIIDMHRSEDASTQWMFQMPEQKTFVWNPHVFDTRIHVTKRECVDLQSLSFSTKSGIKRFVLWVCSKHKHLLTKTHEHQWLQSIQLEKNAVAIQSISHEKTSLNETIKNIMHNVFSFDIDFDSFELCMNTDMTDAILPTSTNKEIQQLNAYYNKKMI